MLLNQLRHQLFWQLDKVKGRPVKDNLNEIKLILDNPNAIEAKRIKEAHLQRLLKHATSTTEFYKSHQWQQGITSFPVIKKTVIQNNFNLFESSEYRKKNNFKVSTSGSTGVPFFLFQDQGKRQRNRADVLFYLDQGDYKIGNKLYELEVWRGHNSKGRLRSWLQNRVQFDISRLTEERIEEFIGFLKADKQTNKLILGFASAFEMIAQYLVRQNIYLKNSGINSVIANAEYLNPNTKTILGKHLGIPVLSRYSSEELGIIAQQTIDNPNNFLVNHASFLVELLNMENDDPVTEGEFGRIVVTDLFNYAMPIIRYDTGDIAKMGLTKNNIMLLEHIEGRKMDLIYDTGGNIISSFVVYTKFHKYYHLLKQYQFIQQDEKNYEVKLNLKEESFEFEDELKEDIKSDFGDDALVHVNYVDEIPALSSGKRRKVVNNFKKA